MANYTQDTIMLFLAIGAILCLASIIGFLLKRRFKDNSVVDNLNQRINAWWVMVLVIGCVFSLGQVAIICLFFCLSGLALREFITITPTTRHDYYALVVAFYIVLPIQYILIAYQWYGLFSIFIPVYGFLIMPVLSSLTGSTDNFLSRTAKTQWGLMISIYCLSTVPALLTLKINHFENRNLLLIIFLLIVVQISDVLQYVWGKLLGSKPIAPNLSPSKTREGFIYGISSASLIGASLWWITPFTFCQAGCLSLMITLFGFLGGLVMSSIKRDSGIKDWGHMIEGHGGILDRLDSVCFAAPIFFHVVRYWWG